MAIRWVRYDDLMQDVIEEPARFTPWLRIYLDTYAPQIFGELAGFCPDAA